MCMYFFNVTDVTIQFNFIYILPSSSPPYLSGEGKPRSLPVCKAPLWRPQSAYKHIERVGEREGDGKAERERENK